METNVVQMDEPSEEKSPTQIHRKWQKELDAAKKRLRKFQKQGNQVVARFLDEKGNTGDMSLTENSPGASRLNLFHKNTQTMLDMMYGQTPKIDVSREHYDPDDDTARVAAMLFQRILQADVEPSGEDLNSTLKAALQDRLLPGLGQARVRYTFETEQVPYMDPATFEMAMAEQVTDERAPIDYVHWQDFLWGWGRTWIEVPWVAFRSWLDEEEAQARFGEEIANQLEYKEQTPGGDDNNNDFLDPDMNDNTQKAEIWEIWSKTNKKVYWHGKGYDKCLDIKDDPLQLKGFFPCPKPLAANTSTNLFVPKADFAFAQDLYNEIDILQGRIATITRAIKVVGLYDQSQGASIGRMLQEAGENELIPVDNWAMFAEKGAIKGVVDWFPVENIVTVLKTLGEIQQNKIQQLYEITGMSDIMRGGDTQQYTSNGTQQLKAKMGAIGIQSLQDQFARFASDIEGLKAEVVAKHYSPESIFKQANAEFIPNADKQYIQPAVQLMQQPDLMWRVNIKPESISMVDYAQLKSERSEFLMSMAQYIQSASSAVTAIPDSLPILMELMKWAMAGFKGSEYLEGAMDQAIQLAAKQSKEQQGQPEEPNPEQIKLQVEEMRQKGQQAKLQGEIQKIQAKSQADMQSQQSKLQTEIQKMQMDAQRDMSLEERQANNRLLEIARDMEASLTEVRANMRADIAVEEAQAAFDMQSQSAAHGYTMTELSAQNRNRSGDKS